MKGLYVFGTFAGLVANPWIQGEKSGVNHRLGVVTSEYQDEYGQPKTETTNINLSKEQYETFKKDQSLFLGKPIFMLVGVRAQKGGREGAWLSYFALKLSKPVLQDVLAVKK